MHWLFICGKLPVRRFSLYLLSEPVEDALVEYGQAGGRPHLPAQQVEGLPGALRPADHHRLVGLTAQLVGVRAPAHGVHSLTRVVPVVGLLEDGQGQAVHHCRCRLGIGECSTALALGGGERTVGFQQLTVFVTGDLKRRCNVRLAFF